GDRRGGDHPQGGQKRAMHRDPGGQLDGQQQSQGWPGGDRLADRVGQGVQHVGGDGCRHPEKQGGADSPADAFELWKLHGVSSRSLSRQASSSVQGSILSTPNDTVVVSGRRVAKVSESKERTACSWCRTRRNTSQVGGGAPARQRFIRMMIRF